MTDPNRDCFGFECLVPYSEHQIKYHLRYYHVLNYLWGFFPIWFFTWGYYIYQWYPAYIANNAWF